MVWLPKCWDLSAAYKQVPLSDEAFHLDSYWAVYDPCCSSAKIFQHCVLPLGSIASVESRVRPPSPHVVSVL